MPDGTIHLTQSCGQGARELIGQNPLFTTLKGTDESFCHRRRSLLAALQQLQLHCGAKDN